MEPMLPPEPPRPPSPPPPPPPFGGRDTALPQLSPSAPYPLQHGGSWMPAAPRRHGLAVAALVCGIAGIPLCMFLGVLPILAIVFGLVSAKAIKASNGSLTGLAMARAGWILGIIGLLLAIVVLVAALSGEFDDDESSLSSVEVGDCVADLPEEDARISGLDVVPCSEPHQGEVFAIDRLNRGRDEEYPGDFEVQRRVEEACVDAFEPYVGLDYARSDFEVYLIRPAVTAWKATEGEYQCILFDPAGDLVGSVRGSGR